MSNQTTNQATETSTSTSSVKSGYINCVKRGWGRLLRVREVQAKRSRDLPTLHAFVAFDDGDGVDCIVSGDAAKAMVLSLKDAVNAAAVQAEPGQKQLKNAHYVDVAVDVGDCFSHDYESNSGEKKIGRKGRLLKVRQVVIDGKSFFDDGTETCAQARTTGGGYLRNVRKYTDRDTGEMVTAVTLQFAHGKTGELEWDTHQLDVLDPAMIAIVEQFKEVANAANPELKNDPTAKPYLNNVWVSASAVDCSSKLVKGKNGDYILRKGVLLSVNKVIVNGVIQFQSVNTTNDAPATAVKEAQDNLEEDESIPV